MFPLWVHEALRHCRTDLRLPRFAHRYWRSGVPGLGSRGTRWKWAAADLVASHLAILPSVPPRREREERANDLRPGDIHTDSFIPAPLDWLRRWSDRFGGSDAGIWRMIARGISQILRGGMRKNSFLSHQFSQLNYYRFWFLTSRTCFDFEQEKRLPCFWWQRIFTFSHLTDSN